MLLSAGLGTRLRPITDTVPKCLVPIHGKPLLGYWLDRLLTAGIERVLINTSYMADAVRAYVSESAWQSRIDLVHEKELLGTGGTVLTNRGYWQDRPFMVIHADNLSRFDISRFIAAHASRPAGVEITMMTFATDTPQSCGIVELDERGVVVAFHEKVTHPPGNHANAAVYIFEPSVLEEMAALNKLPLDISTEVLPHYLGRMHTFHNDDYHRDIGTPESLRLAEIEYREG